MLCSLDTNILIYAADKNAEEHRPAYLLIEKALAEPSVWMIADQVLFEFYKALRNPKIFRRPLDPAGAADRLHFLRNESGFLRCGYELDFWNEIFPLLSHAQTPYQRTHDIVLGVTLARNAVTTFYTRNTKDFEGLGIAEVINPIDL
jgi:predicted nucleic acid-binding protein